MNRIPAEDAFAIYAALGSQRSYQAVADHFGVTKRAVTDLAQRDNWQERIAKIDEAVRQRGDERATESLEQMTERHTKILKALQKRGLETLTTTTMSSAVAARVVLAALKEERDLRSMPTADGAEAEAESMAARICAFVAAADSITMVDPESESDSIGEEHD